jgi:hypothetical protein
LLFQPIVGLRTNFHSLASVRQRLSYCPDAQLASEAPLCGSIGTPSEMLRPDFARTQLDQGPSCQSAPSMSSHVTFASKEAATVAGRPSQVPNASTFAGP